MIKRQKNIEFQYHHGSGPIMAATNPARAAYAAPSDALQDMVDQHIREMYCEAVAEPLPAEILALLGRLGLTEAKQRLN
ncbi:MAG: hypothetical protein PW843_14680 [Azospirillaceae bacterium]|nr:hypothetical protein [Azospirillaceae bacterium]